MSNLLKVVSGNTNVLLIINGKGVPAQITKPSDKDANEHWRFLVRDDRLSEFFPYVAQLEARETCELDNDRHCSNCGAYVHEKAVLVRKDLDGGTWTIVAKSPNFCPNCGKAVKR